MSVKLTTPPITRSSFTHSPFVKRIKPIIQKFGGKPLAITSKALGVATLASIVYDAHVNGRERSYAVDSDVSANRLYNQFNQYSRMEKSSATLAKFKKMWFNAQRNFAHYDIAPKVFGYLAGVGQTLFDNLHLIGLSAVALKSDMKSKLGKAAGILIALNGINTFLCDVIGFKNSRHKNSL